MSCPQHETTLAWLYGEAPDAHLAHVGGCSECQATLEAHESVLAVASVAPVAVPRPANRGGFRLGIGALVLAASLAIAMLPTAPPPSPAAPSVATAYLPDTIDVGLDALDTELDDLIGDLSDDL